MRTTARVAIVGFSAFEHAKLEAFLRLAERRVPAYTATASMHEADLVLIDLGNAQAMQDASAWAAKCVGVGAQPHAGLLAHVPRPINMTALLRLFDTLSSGHQPADPRVDAALDIDVDALVAPTAAMAPSPGGLVTEPAPLSYDARLAAPHMEEVLIVDAREDVLRVLGEILGRFGFAVHLARSGEEALYRLPREHFDHVFLDAGLTVVEAHALCKLIKKQALAAGKAPPFVVLLNAEGGIVERMRSRLAGFDACLTKPLRHDELLQLIGPHIVPSAAMADTALAPLRAA